MHLLLGFSLVILAADVSGDILLQLMDVITGI